MLRIIKTGTILALMKKSTDMFLAGDNRIQSNEPIILRDDIAPQGEAYSPFILSLRENILSSSSSATPAQYSQPIKTKQVSAEKKVIPDENQAKPIGYEHLFAAAANMEDSDIPDRKTQIEKARESMERFEKEFSSSSISTRNNGGFFRRITSLR